MNNDTASKLSVYAVLQFLYVTGITLGMSILVCMMITQGGDFDLGEQAGDNFLLISIITPPVYLAILIINFFKFGNKKLSRLSIHLLFAGTVMILFVDPLLYMAMILSN